MFRFFKLKKWFMWSWLGSFIILSSLWLQVKIDVKKLTRTATPTYIAARVIKDNKLDQYSLIVIAFGSPKAF